MILLIMAGWLLVALMVLFIANIFKRIITDIYNSESFYKCFKLCFKKATIIPMQHGTVTSLPINSPVSSVPTLQVSIVADLN